MTSSSTLSSFLYSTHLTFALSLEFLCFIYHLFLEIFSDTASDFYALITVKILLVISPAY